MYLTIVKLSGLLRLGFFQANEESQDWPKQRHSDRMIPRFVITHNSKKIPRIQVELWKKL
jgi:hypothetical protein